MCRAGRMFTLWMLVFIICFILWLVLSTFYCLLAQFYGDSTKNFQWQWGEPENHQAKRHTLFKLHARICTDLLVFRHEKYTLTVVGITLMLVCMPHCTLSVPFNFWQVNENSRFVEYSQSRQGMGTNTGNINDGPRVSHACGRETKSTGFLEKVDNFDTVHKLIFSKTKWYTTIQRHETQHFSLSEVVQPVTPISCFKKDRI